jgi:hypothetical protein
MKLRSILAAAALAALTFATADTLADAGGTVTLGQFSYTLTDLDPNDGISPSLTFLPLTGLGDQAAQIKMVYESGASAPTLIKQSTGTEPPPPS